MATAFGATPESMGLNIGDPPFVVLPDLATMFARRAERFRGLAADHPLGPFLAMLASLAAAQQRLTGFGPSPVLDEADVARALDHTMPPIPKDMAADPAVAALLDALVVDLASSAEDDGLKLANERLAAMPGDARGALVASVAEGAFPLEQLAEAAIVAAALQVWFARAAASLDPGRLKSVEEGLCPACGGVPVASLVVGWPASPSARYLCCSLCTTFWNYVRVKCTTCASTQGISYRRIDGQSADMAAEVCDGCKAYTKHLIQEKNPQIDPFADDIASYGLDVLLRDEGWKRATINPFFVG